METRNSTKSFLYVIILALGVTVITVTAYAGPGKKELTRINSDGAVTVRATYMNPVTETEGDELIFEIRLNTHSIDLDAYKVNELSILKDDKGNTYGALGWFNPGGGGHHRFGLLKFAGTDERGAKIINKDTKFITLIMKDIDNVKERRFQWTFPLK